MVTFFEKNGLQHGELQLRGFQQEDEQNVVFVRELEWNCDSSVLAVWLYSDKERGQEITWSSFTFIWRSFLLFDFIPQISQVHRAAESIAKTGILLLQITVREGNIEFGG